MNDLHSLSDLRVPADQILRLLRSGLGLKQILERCPEVSEYEVQRVMHYYAGMTFWQMRAMQPVPPPPIKKDDDEDGEKPAKKSPSAAKTMSPPRLSLAPRK